MKFQNLIAAIILISPIMANAQKLNVQEVEMPISKDAKKKGMYVVTQDQGENIRTILAYDLKKDKLGFDVVSFDKQGNLISTNSEIADGTVEKKYNITIPEPGTIQIPGNGKTALRLVSATGMLGSMKFQKGHFEPVYKTAVNHTSGYYTNTITYTSVLQGYKFIEDETYKSGTKINVFALHTNPEENIERNFGMVEGLFAFNTVGYMFENSKAAFIGKDARFDSKSEHAHNVIVTGLFDGPTQSYENIQQHILDYNINKVTDGYTSKGDRAVLLSTLNAPTTIKEHKKYQADGIPYMTYFSYDIKGNVVNNVTFKSASVRGNFGIFGADNAEYILGSIDGDHDGYYRADMGKASHFQIVKISNNAVEKQRVFTYEELEEKLRTPGGKKGKLKIKDIHFTSFEKLPNGDLAAIATSANQYLIFQFNSSLEVKAVYVIDRLKGEGLFHTGTQLLVSGESVYVLFTEQSPGIAQGTKMSVSKGAGYNKNINFSTVDEVMNYGRIVKIDCATNSCSEPVDYDEDVIMGDKPMIAGINGSLLLPVRDKKSNYSINIIQ